MIYCSDLFTAVYQNQNDFQTGIMPSTDADLEEAYSDIENDDDEQTYENVPTNVNGVPGASGESPPLPPRKDHKPGVPPKTPQAPVVPPKQVRGGQKQQNTAKNNSPRGPEKPARTRHHKVTFSPKVSETQLEPKPATPPVTRSAAGVQNDVGNDFQSELLKKLQKQRIKNEHGSNVSKGIRSEVPTPATPKRAGKKAAHVNGGSDRPILPPRSAVR